ncbi:hypothetical protein [Mucilaginibacter sp. UYCu711]|uniref:hypothetical protein n=1 Tax=Mucilaginibacter sp. UYCu711 TaxID=3156339 RepID=UPI003D1D1A09
MKIITKKKELKESYNSTIFSKIYQKNGWGGKKGEFYSGPGSHNFFIKGYTKVVADFILDNDVHTIVEIGCGDFNVSSGILNILDDVNHDYTYIGYDVVKSLIARNKSLYGSSKIDFVCKDSCVGRIKGGDLLIIRQVLQHLNNKSIKQITDKFKNYKYIIFTEHQASEKYGELIVPNTDQSTGVSIRLTVKSGVYLDKTPFNLKIDSKLFSIPQWLYGLDAFINTYLIKIE